MINWQPGDRKPKAAGVYLRRRTTCAIDAAVEYSLYDRGVWHLECCYAHDARLEKRVSNYQDKPWAFQEGPTHTG